MNNPLYSFQKPANFYPPNIYYNPSHVNRSFGQFPSTLTASRKLENVNCMQQQKNQYGGLYIGDIISVVKPQNIRNYKIAAIVSCTAETNYPVNLPPGVARIVIPANDSLNYPINIHFQQAFNFIQNMRKSNKNVLVHCHAGVSRSAAIVCAYLMKKNSWNFDSAISFMKQRRNRVKPNDNFVRILKQYQKNCFNSTSQLGQSRLFKSVRGSFDGFNKINTRNPQQISSLRNSLQGSIQLSNNLNPRPQVNPLYNQTLNQSRKKAIQVPHLNSSLQIKNSPYIHDKNELKINQSKDLRIRSYSSLNKFDIGDRVEQKVQSSFGSILKNKISQFFDKKKSTRIPWELSRKRTFQRQRSLDGLENNSYFCF